MWLLRKEVADEMSRQFRIFDGREALISREQRESFLAAFEPIRPTTSAGPMLPRCGTVAGDVLEICVEGVLTEKPNFFAYYFGGGNCTYESIRQCLAIAKAEPSIKRVVFRMRSGGGHFTGLFETLAAIESMTKPMSVTASEACSAAYAIAASVGKIEASTIASEFGSIGVAQNFCFDNDETEIAVTSTEAPNKRPDVRTAEGRAVVVEELDAIHELFVGSIATGRGTNIKNVNATYGRGAVFLAGKAKKLGMIDKISKPMPAAIRNQDSMPEDDESPDASTVQVVEVDTSKLTALVAQFQESIEAGMIPRDKSSSQLIPAESTAKQEPPAAPQAKPESSAGAEQTTKPKGVKMDLATLMAQHPELYKSITETATAAATTAERKRVNALLRMGTKCGAMDVAVKAVESGATIQDDEVFEAFQSARMNGNAQAARQSDDAAAAAALGDAAAGSATAAAKQDLGDQIMALDKARTSLK